MKKITILMLAFLAVSCIEKNDVRPGSPWMWTSTITRRPARTMSP